MIEQLGLPGAAAAADGCGGGVTSVARKVLSFAYSVPVDRSQTKQIPSGKRRKPAHADAEAGEGVGLSFAVELRSYGTPLGITSVNSHAFHFCKMPCSLFL